jgi:hypothetical protein
MTRNYLFYQIAINFEYQGPHVLLMNVTEMYGASVEFQVIAQLVRPWRDISG